MSTNINKLRKIAAPLSTINLGVTIRPAKETFREQVCGLLVDWLNELVNGKTRFFDCVPNGDSVIRNILCEELCAEWELRLPLALLTTGLRTTNIEAEDADDDDDEDDMKEDILLSSSIEAGEDVEMFEPEGTHSHGATTTTTAAAAAALAAASSNVGSSKLNSPESSASSPIIYRNQRDIASIDWDPAAMVREYQHLREEAEGFGDTLYGKKGPSQTSVGKKPVTVDKETAQNALNMQKEFEEKLRLDYFMLYDLKLWKEVRISLRELYISSLASNPRFKKILGKRLARNYARLAESFLLRDREPENSIILFSVQLLTVPTVSDLLVHDYYFFGLICSTLTAFFLTDRLYLLLPSERATLPSRINCESRAFRTRRYFNAFHDLRYIMNVDMIKQVLAQDPLYLRQYLDLISLFQGMNAQICQKDTHVEYESEIWVNAFNVTLQIAKCCRQFSDCFAMLPVDTAENRKNTAVTLVRAISRILKKIQNWGSNDDEEDNKAAGTTPATVHFINGTAAQKFHAVTLKYPQEFTVIKYNVATEPVSFHHPLHWLLSGLLEYAHLLDDETLRDAGWEGGFKSVITLFDTSETPAPDVLLPILDFPVRTIVFSSQIRAGVWVRNGYGIRNQAHHYRDISLRENTYDADVFLLQLGFSTIDSNRFLATLLDRFDLGSWFMGQTKHGYYDPSQTVFMVEEILNLLIVCACERANIVGMSIQDKIRREIIHNLCLGTSAYSELTKRIPERITEHPDFDKILSQVAHFKSPDGVNDHGTYELKQEYFDHVDTYFWHYSRNNREEAESILCNKWKRANPDKKEDEFFILPKSEQISKGPFQCLGQFLQSEVFVAMMAFAMWNVRVGDHHKSDTILDQTLYLILLALNDDNNSLDKSTNERDGFFQYATELHFTFDAIPPSLDTLTLPKREMSLFEIMVMLHREERFAEVNSRLLHVFDALERRGPKSSLRAVQNWRANIALQESENAEKLEKGGAPEMSEMEKKKLAAKERQMKIMAQFAQAQSQFMELNNDLYDEDVDDEFVDFDGSQPMEKEPKEGESADDVHQFCAYPTGTCIVCQEDVNERSLPYGLLGLIQTSNILRETPMDDASLFNDIYKMGPNLDVDWEDHQCLSDDAVNVSGFPAQLHKTGLYASSCGHLMHIKCFEVYCTSIDSRHSAQLTRNHPENRTRREFMCPLCKSLGNILLPVFWKGKRESYPGAVSKSEESDYATFYKTQVNQIMYKLKHGISTASRLAANSHKRSGSNSNERIKDVMSQLLPSLPSGTTTTAVATTTAAGQTIGREWATWGVPPRIPVPPVLDAPTPNPPVPPLPEQVAENLAQGNNPTNAPPTTTEDTAAAAAAAVAAAETEEDTLLQAYLNTSNPPIMPDGKLGPFENDTIHSAAMVSVPFIKKSYSRLLDVLAIIYQEICNDDSQRELSIAASNVDMLWGLMGYTIAGVEIAARGTTSTGDTHTLFDQIPSQTQMLLRIISDTVMAYTTLMSQALSDINKAPTMTTARVHMLAMGRMRQIFEVNIDDIVHLTGPDKIVIYDNSPLLQDDPFMILTELSLHLVPVTQADIHPFIRTLFLAELAKASVGLLQDRLGRAQTEMHQTAPSEPSQDITAAKKFAFSLMSKLNFTPQEAADTFDKFNNDAAFCALLKSFALPFLRRTVVLMIARFGLLLSTQEEKSGESEMDRLLGLLRLPSFSDMLQSTPITESLLHHWCAQHLKESERQQQQRLVHVPLDLPTPLYLVALPHRLDRLFDESLRRVCHKCGTVPSDPALCLFCGTFVCAQSFCCSEDEEGECNLHTLE